MFLRYSAITAALVMSLALSTSYAAPTAGTELRVDQAPRTYGVDSQQVVALASGERFMGWIQFPPLGVSPDRIQVVGRVNVNGQALSNPVTISTTPGMGGLSNLRVAARGNDVFAAWERVAQLSPIRYEIRFNHSSDGGATWGQDRAISPGALNAEGGFSLALGPRADVFVAFAATQTQDHVYLVRSLDNGAVWRPAKRIDHSSGASRPSIAADTLGRVVVVWSDLREGRSIFGNHSLDEGQNFAAGDAEVATSEGLGIVVEADGSGNFFTGFEASQGSEIQAFVSRSLNSGQTWEPELRIDLGDAGIQPATLQLFVGEGGKVFSTAVYSLDGTFGLFFRKSDDNGATFEPPRQLDSAPGGTQVFMARIVGGTNGVVLVPWAQLQTGTSPGVVLARVSTDSGNTWSDIVALSGTRIASRAFPEAVIGPPGRSAAVAWQEGTAPQEKLFFNVLMGTE